MKMLALCSIGYHFERTVVGSNPYRRPTAEVHIILGFFSMMVTCSEEYLISRPGSCWLFDLGRSETVLVLTAGAAGIIFFPPSL